MGYIMFVNIDKTSPIYLLMLSSHEITLTLFQRSKLQEVVYFCSMTVLPPLSSFLPASRLFCLTCCHPQTAVPSLLPRGLCWSTGCCQPTLERDMGKFTNSAPACPGRQKLEILIERRVEQRLWKHIRFFSLFGVIVKDFIQRSASKVSLLCFGRLRLP